MNKRDQGKGPEARPHVPRAVVYVLSELSWLAVFGLAPLSFGRRGRRFGGRERHPTALNRLGLVPVGLGAAGWAWCLAARYAPGEAVPVSLVPEHLIAKGPYRISRNPMYVSEVATLLGWTIYFGSPGLLSGVGLLAAALRYAVSREERTLRDRFGDSWVTYAAKVPRWI